MRKQLINLAMIFALFLAWQGAAWGQMATIQQGTILHCFDWKYTDIQAELANIKAAGFTAVQTSPAQTNWTGQTEWNTLYRPRDSKIGPNSIGTKAELQALCTAAHAVGLKVIVDVVANHTDGSLDVVADFWKNNDLYHDWNLGANDGSRNDVTHGNIGMHDLKTEDPRVQQKFKQYVQDLKAIGVDGCRWDAAKHIGLPSEGDQFWNVVLDKDMYNYGEILNTVGGNQDSKLLPEYTSLMSITDATYSTQQVLANAKNGKATDVAGSWSFVTNNNKFVYWGESHDNFCNNGDASYGVSQEVVDRAYAIAASHNQIPALYFSRPNGGNTSGPSAKVPAKGSTHFTSKAVAAVNAFHNAMDGKGDYYTASGNVASSTRKGGGAIVVNFSGAGNVSVANGGGYATPGTYTDQVSGNTWTITSSTISGQTDGTGIAVLYNATPSDAAGVTLSQNGGTFTSETTTVTLTPNDNTSSAWYSIDDGARTTFTSATTVTLGSGIDFGQSTTLSWGAINAKGDEVTGSATFTKQDPNAAISIYVEASSAPYIYVWYDDNGTTKEPNGDWNNTKAMTASSDGWYVFTVPAGLSKVNFIITDASRNKLTDDCTATSTVYYKINGSSAAETTDRPGNNPGPDPQPSSYEPYLDSNDEISVFFETSDGKTPSAWVWGDAGNYNTNGAWPGDEMTLQGTLASGAKVYKWTYTGTQTALPSGIIFTHDGGTKYDDADGTFTNHGYYTTSSPKQASKTITKVNGGDDPTPPDPQPTDKQHVYFVDSEGWGVVSAWIYDDTQNYTGGTWPGEAMTKVSQKGDNGEDIYEWVYTGTSTLGSNVSVMFNNNNGGKQAPGANEPGWVFENGAFYNTSGKTTTPKSFSGDNPTPDPDPDPTPDPDPDPTPDPDPQPQPQGNLASYYQTNPNGAGQKKTVAIDGNMTGWTANDIIAQGAANDDARVFCHWAMHENPYDLYALYGAYDDNNVYLMVEMTNVQDVVAPSDPYPLSDNGTLILHGNMPVWFAFDTGDAKTAVSGALTPWDKNAGKGTNKITGKVNRFVAISYDGQNGPFVYDGNGSELFNTTTSGITRKAGMGILSSTIYGINAAGTDQGRTVGDMSKDNEANAKWVDFNQNGHESAKHDYHFELSIPLKDLGVTASDVASKGLGVMVIGTAGVSGMDCLPYDMGAVNDNADQPYSADESTSKEKEDDDVFSVPFAYIGNVSAGINDINAAEKVAKKDNAWYTITGARLAGKPAQSGIYIHAGKKVVIK